MQLVPLLPASLMLSKVITYSSLQKSLGKLGVSSISMLPTFSVHVTAPMEMHHLLPQVSAAALELPHLNCFPVFSVACIT